MYDKNSSFAISYAQDLMQNGWNANLRTLLK